MKITLVNRKKELPLEEFTQVVFNSGIKESRMIKDAGGRETLEIKPQVQKEFNWRQFILAGRQMMNLAKKHGAKKIVLDYKIIEGMKLKAKPEEIMETLVTNFEMANYEFIKYKTRDLEGHDFVEEVVIIIDSANIKALEKAAARGQMIGEIINSSRDMSNAPGADLTPKVMAAEIGKMIKGTAVEMRTLNDEDMEHLGMGAILGVAKGSESKPKFIILEYNGNISERPIVLIGKAVTFDSGGMDLKTFEGLQGMNMDMSGGSAVAHAIMAAAKLGIKKRVIGLIPAVENMLSGDSLRIGDVLKTMSGLTVEVQSTDAEGRLILADALTYAEKYDPKAVIDVATLTGAAVVALGERASAIFSKNESLINTARELGEKSGDYVWPFPLWDEYEPEIKGQVADIANLRTAGNPRYGGTILGAMFLYQFAKKFPKWMHIDMAPRDKSLPDEFLAKGSSGAPIRLLIKLIEKL